jgi:hypothetical protein
MCSALFCTDPTASRPQHGDQMPHTVYIQSTTYAIPAHKLAVVRIRLIRISNPVSG